MKLTSGSKTKFLAGLCSVLFWTAAAAGQDFTFNVPVELHKITPNITRGSVDVVLYTKDWAPKRMVTPAEAQIAHASLVASGNTNFLIANGEYAGTVTIPISVPPNVPGKSAADAFYYEIMLNLWDTVLNTNGTLEMENGPYGFDSSQPFVVWISGKIQDAVEQAPAEVHQQSEGRETVSVIGDVRKTTTRPPSKGIAIMRQISNFQVLSRTSVSLMFSVNYAVPLGPSSGLTLGAVALANGQPSALIFCREVQVEPGNHSARLTLAATAEGPRKTVQTDKVRVFLKSLDKKELSAVVFDCPATWSVGRK